MNPRSTVLVLLVLAALGAYVYWVELPGDTQKSEEERLLVLDEEAVTGISLTFPDRKLVLAKNDDGWRLTEPVDAGADATAVKNLLHVIGGAKITRTLEDVDDKLASYGLEEPAAVLALTTSDGTNPPALKVGEATSVGFSSYAQRSDDPNVYITAATFRSGMLKEPHDLRDKRVLIFEDQDVQRIGLVHAGEGEVETLVLERPDANTDWQITAPAKYAADGSETRALLSSTRGIRITDFVSDEADVDLAPYGLDTPRLALTIGTGEDDPPQTLLLGGAHVDEEKKEIYAKRTDTAAIYSIPEFALKNLGKDLTTLRDKTVVRYDADAAATIEVTRVDGAGFILAKADDGWHFQVSDGGDDGNEAEGTERAPTISRFVDDLHGFKGNLIVREGGFDLSAFRLDPPELRIAIRDGDGTELGALIASGGTVEGKDAIAYVMAQGSEILYAAKPYVFQRIDKKAADFRDTPNAAATPMPGGAPPAPAAPPAAPPA